MTTYKYTHGANLFDAADINKVVVGKFINANGDEQVSPPGDTLNHTGYIPVEANKIYKRIWTGPAITTSQGLSVAWYDNTKTYISRSESPKYPIGTTEMEDNFTAPANAAYAIINFISETWPNANVSLEFYETEVKWRETEGYQYKAGENLFDAATNNVTTGKYINQDGEVTPTGNTGPSRSNYTDYIPVEAGKTYKRTWHGPALTIAGSARIAWYNSSKTFLSSGFPDAYPIGTTNMVNTIVAPADAAYAILNFPSATWPNSDVSLEFYETEVKWREATAHEYSSGSWD